jgi:hypothetical protein
MTAPLAASPVAPGGVIILDRFPHGLDYAWLAVDAVGHVAIFTNAGLGPIPAAVLADREKVDRAEELVRQLPERCDYELFVTMPRPDDYVAFARRGLFAYDWEDAHRKTGHTRRYELVTRPNRPVLVEELDPAVATLAELVRFEQLRFAEHSSIEVTEL